MKIAKCIITHKSAKNTSERPMHLVRTTTWAKNGKRELYGAV